MFRLSKAIFKLNIKEYTYNAIIWKRTRLNLLYYYYYYCYIFYYIYSLYSA